MTGFSRNGFEQEALRIEGGGGMATLIPVMREHAAGL